MAIEDLEYAKRKFHAALLMLSGILCLIILFILFMVLDYEDIDSKAFFLVMLLIMGTAFFLFGYGGYIWRKVTHVVWTKQAIREMRDQELRAEDEYYRAKHVGNTDMGQSEKKVELTCSDCGTAINANVNFCPNCGSKIHE